MRSSASQWRSFIRTGLLFAGRISVGTPRTKPASKPAFGQHVDQRHFLGDAHRLAAIGDRIAEDQEARLVVSRASAASTSGAAGSTQVAVW